VLTEHPATHTFTLKLREPVNLIRLGRMDLSPVAGSSDNRTMGIGLVSLTLSPEKRRWWMLPRRVPVLPKPKAEVALSGVVFTTMLNPRDGRKNWIDILTAFCHALGDRTDATLVIKMTHFSVASFLGELLTKLEEVGPSLMPTRWPNDPTHRLRTQYYRIDWESLAGRFREAYTIATGEPDRYRLCLDVS
jgi:hypothetical protein